MTDSNELYRKARRSLARRDPVLKKVMAQVGDCTLLPDPFRLGSLVRAIIAQQISTRAAQSIHIRLQEALGPTGITAAALLAVPDDLLRGAGLSANKARSLRDLAAKIESRLVPLDDLHQHDDETVITQLIQVRGIGRWTAQMFLIFSLGRLDILPVDDFGLRQAVQRHYNLLDLPGRSELETLGAAWKPYRSVATWYMWRSGGPAPRPDAAPEA